MCRDLLPQRIGQNESQSKRNKRKQFKRNEEPRRLHTPGKVQQAKRTGRNAPNESQPGETTQFWNMLDARGACYDGSMQRVMLNRWFAMRKRDDRCKRLLGVNQWFTQDTCDSKAKRNVCCVCRARENPMLEAGSLRCLRKKSTVLVLNCLHIYNTAV